MFGPAHLRACVPNRRAPRSTVERPPPPPLGPAGPGTAGLAGKPRRCPTARHALRGRPCAHPTRSASDGQPQRQWHLEQAHALLDELESPTLLHCIHPQDRHLSRVRPVADGERGSDGHRRAVPTTVGRNPGWVPDGHTLDSCPAPQAADGRSADRSLQLSLLSSRPALRAAAYGAALAPAATRRLPGSRPQRPRRAETQPRPAKPGSAHQPSTPADWLLTCQCAAPRGPMAEATTRPMLAASSGRPRPAARSTTCPGRPGRAGGR
jgi:hypothetical protein